MVATRRPDPAPAALPAGEGTPSPVERVVRRLRRARFRSKVLRRPLVEVRRLGLGPDDVLIASYPRSGTNWLMFLVAEAITGEPSQFGAVHRRIPYIGGQRRAPRLLPDGGRIVYTHETHPIGRRRAVYLVRDPRDVVLSEYRWQQMTGVFDGDLDTFVDAFVTGRGNPWGAWDRHVRTWLARADEPGSRVEVVRYEALHASPVHELDRVLRSLGVVRPRRVLEGAVAANTVEAMRAKERGNPEAFAAHRKRDLPFVGAGAVSGWRGRLGDRNRALVEERFGPTMTLLGYEVGPGAQPTTR